jgi:hypothetical protein
LLLSDRIFDMRTKIRRKKALNKFSKPIRLSGRFRRPQHIDPVDRIVVAVCAARRAFPGGPDDDRDADSGWRRVFPDGFGWPGEKIPGWGSGGVHAFALGDSAEEQPQGKEGFGKVRHRANPGSFWRLNKGGF